MKLKRGVKVQGVRSELLLALSIADGIWRDHGRELVVTSLLDSKHSMTSLHYTGCAADLRTRYFDAPTRQKVSDALGNALTRDYDVIVEKDHIHLEYQPRR